MQGPLSTCNCSAIHLVILFLLDALSWSTFRFDRIIQKQIPSTIVYEDDMVSPTSEFQGIVMARCLLLHTCFPLILEALFRLVLPRPWQSSPRQVSLVFSVAACALSL